MIKIGDLEIYAAWVKELHGHIVRVNGPGIDNKKKMIVTFIPKEDTVVLLGGMCSFISDNSEPGLTRPINDQFNTEINITRYPESISGPTYIYRLLIKSGQTVIRAGLSKDHMETLIANLKVVVNRDIDNFGA